jgi:hypothetical protein
LNYRKKLIEVALPVEAINKPSARAVIFAQIVDDHSTCATVAADLEASNDGKE